MFTSLHLSHVTCQESHVTGHMLSKICEEKKLVKVVKLVGGRINYKLSQAEPKCKKTVEENNTINI